MTESRGGVEPPFSKRSVQLTIAAIALTVSLGQLVTLIRMRVHHGNDRQERGIHEARQWGELSGRGHPLIQIDINRADSRELALLPGVGPILARRIVGNRARLGPFESLEDLSRVHGIGDKKIEQIQVLGYAGGVPKGRRRASQPRGGQAAGEK